ncbi:MAG: hypothetical protein A3B74_03175 [Candidatus Kerfeldbacteria bacterium RIFCSPHIGHO2_02_FULL_42_14]|uniref:Amine oxidase domain-containing protein n=1 Tax=Candidatus Kerfeldbacteria bacterium RIFCSPHIGHO2_02_FULL_42_14 TaxID=1798540 RepID=A0A1G2AQ46_9BACT|nr:MAG: hypothetical protein A3B74_03175 [Candidatus Kerfeldbacteria bacterium RIFCSPHIGHO2_02_FULL_42_14]OGY80910.1 MAG: hypothetical protein A3E60_03090 [Candidatus Kerfeldbacteria bacterium RIFCSPHIGHO2_12_FULL_42_13]OGY84143.1 MAG: hypothetical protein A3I91_01490 [Candidatus Kerfeldbacteria bacterium RIFCSPLOWO2_02_FULL_42_19]OGY87273.1 MAG: hypothetical protein A3G01_02960 [Candidatus Kerfeldbacteria bacterium RIFCSPLOWO2_12_FULL_43_9]
MKNHISQQMAIIIGAGPAGLTAAYELLERTSTKPIIFELDDKVGGLARTVHYKGNRMDIGGHRFFSKSDRVMHWWLNILPLQSADSFKRSGIETERINISYQHRSRAVQVSPDGPDPAISDRVMLIRKRKSRIFFLRNFFDYPLSLNFTTLRRLGLLRVVHILLSYIRARFFPRRPETSLEDFFINRFGRVLYLTFFKDYTEKVWGVSCKEISAAWGRQRVKGVSISKALGHALQKFLPKRTASLSQKSSETSLIEYFLYPKFGPGQMWQEVARAIECRGGSIFLQHSVIAFRHDGRNIFAAHIRDKRTGKTWWQKGDYFFSTMPVQSLIAGLGAVVPSEVRDVAASLCYRDFMSVGLLVRKLRFAEYGRLMTDNWIYVQEKDVRLGRIQIWNNWSPYLVQDPNTVWLGLEYFCNEGDELWRKSDQAFLKFATAELAKLGFIDAADVLDGCVVRVPKAYPAYFGSYDRFSVIRTYLDRFANLFSIGRNGMHRYNNQDHSMLAAMTAVDSIVDGVISKDALWRVNTEVEYHEER